jgi:hypothetical protein
MNHLASIATLALLFSATHSALAADHDTEVAAAPPTSAAACESATHLTRVQQTVVDKAAQGIRPLVQYIHRTRFIYQLDVMETVAWLDQRRELRRACAQRVATLE